MVLALLIKARSTPPPTINVTQLGAMKTERGLQRPSGVFHRNPTAGEDVAQRKTRRKEHKERLHAQTRCDDCCSRLPRGPCHWPKHTPVSVAAGGRRACSAHRRRCAVQTGRCELSGTGQRCSPDKNLSESKPFTAHTSTMRTGRLIITFECDSRYLSSCSCILLSTQRDSVWMAHLI